MLKNFLVFHSNGKRTYYLTFDFIIFHQLLNWIMDCVFEVYRNLNIFFEFRFMPLVTLIETIIFTYHCIHLSTEHGLTISWDGPVPYCSVLIYDPYKRYQVWRYITYMFVHIGVLHYIFNMIMQLLVGVFLEMEQEDWKGSFRVAAVYFSGVIAGSLGTSIVNPNTYVAGNN